MERQFNNSLLSEANEEEGADSPIVPAQEEVVPAPRVRVRIGDSYREVDQDLADMLEAERKKRDDDYFRKISEQGQQISQLRDEVARSRPQDPAPEEDTTAADEAFYGSPTKAIEARLTAERKRIKEEVTEELTKAYETRTQTEKSQQDYAKQFYAKHPHLVGKEDLVYSIYGQNAEKLNSLNWAQQHEMIAELVDQQVERWTGTKLPRGDAPAEKPMKRTMSTKTVVSERGTSKGPAQPISEAEDEEDDLSSFLRKERLRNRRVTMESRN